MRILTLLCCVLLSACYSSQLTAPNNIPTAAQPTLVIISIDGLRHDYLTLHQAPMLSELARLGVQVKQLQPVFPSKTFPNHYSFVTGLHPEQHGIVDNSIFDPATGRQFALNKPKEVGDGFWWQGEPIWVTAEKQGVSAATYFFPGTEAEINGVRPSFWFTYNGATPNRQRTQQVLDWLAMPAAKRPRLITLYFSDVDTAGHDFGPNALETAQALANIDAEIAYLVESLRSRGQLSDVNLLISSDHGMAEVDQRQHIVADSYFDSSLAKSIRFSREIISIFPNDGQEEVIYQQIAAQYNPEQMRLYRKTELPARFFHQQHERIAPIILLAQAPWIFIRESAVARLKADARYLEPRGSHGYDNSDADMQATLIAYGPAFKRASTVDKLSMVDFYNVMAAVLQITPAKNAGDPRALDLLLATD